MAQGTIPVKQDDELFGCKLCRSLNDGICNSYCLMDKAQKRAFVQTNADRLRRPAQ